MGANAYIIKNPVPTSDELAQLLGLSRAHVSKLRMIVHQGGGSTRIAERKSASDPLAAGKTTRTTRKKR